MNLNAEHKEFIASEFADVLERMEKAKSPLEVLYYFSASFGAINRVINFNYDKTLVFVHQVLQHLHGSIQNRLQAGGPNPAEHMVVPPEFFEAMKEILDYLREAIVSEANDRIYRALEKASNLTYATSGNGYYLYLKGKLEL